jgi:hypothetical protein
MRPEGARLQATLQMDSGAVSGAGRKRLKDDSLFSLGWV